MGLGTRIFVTRARSANRRAARQRRRQLVRELAGYSSQAQRDDFAATLDRYPDGVTHELRGILNRRPASQAIPGMGRR